MPHPSARLGLFALRSKRQFAPFPLLLLAAIGPSPAAAAPAPDVLQPLGILGNASRPSCAGSLSPLEATDRVGDEGDDDFPSTGPAPAELTAISYAFEFLPAVRVCSPTFAGIPGPIGGSIATAPKRTRVGTGWRELGGTFVQPAALTPGDTITLPEVDDAAIAQLSVARTSDLPTAAIALSDLSPGPSTVTVAEDARGLIATLVRADGTTTEGIVKPAVALPVAAEARGTSKRWNIDLKVPTGSFVFANSYSYYGGSYDEQTHVAPPTSDGVARIVIRPPVPRKSRRTAIQIGGVVVNREAHLFTTFSCVVAGTRKGRPQKPSCSPDDSDDYLYDDDGVESPFDDWGSLSGTAREVIDTAGRSVADAARAARNLTQLPRIAGGAAAVSSKKAGALKAHRNAVMGRSASRAEAAPLVAREIPRASTIQLTSVGVPRPLAADVNGDRAPDFWTEWAPDDGAATPLLRTSAGYLLLSSPSGLVARRVDIPTTSVYGGFNSELSAIADVTGDGIGELVVDLQERHALIPGSRSWTTSPAPVRAPLPGDLNPGEILLQPSASSPGAPYAAVDDASGDGRLDLVGTDDLGGWYAVASSALRSGTPTRLPTVTRALPVPRPVKAALAFEPAAPRVDPRVRVIAGQAVALRWPTVASVKAPEGTVEIAVRTGSGAAVRPTITVKTPGNAVLLDYDRISGDVLLLAVAPRCTVGRNYLRGRCRETFLRVRADGSTRQALTVNPRSSISYVGAARFVTDGPDADGDVDVVYTVGNRGLGLADSTRSGVLSEKTLAVTTIVGVDTPFYEELRPIPVVDPTGARTLTVALPIEVKPARSRWSDAATVPAVIGWK